jgi:hypothetical protein
VIAILPPSPLLLPLLLLLLLYFAVSGIEEELGH